MCSWLPFSLWTEGPNKGTTLSSVSDPQDDTFWDLLKNHSSSTSWVAQKWLGS